MSGSTRKYSISIPEDLAETVKAKVGSGGFSAYVTEAVRQQMAMDKLSEIVDDHEVRFGPLSDQDLAWAAEVLDGQPEPGAEPSAA
ncbi:hypothetical protein [Streptomyces sp. NPDC000410]|uniref:hypothetical protein n=1 Tax=Streptomyces sp. NPDC000410 TaxID=3154254 RepID=UPI003318E05E